MSSTRKAKDETVFHPSRYASAPEFERGLAANLVAKRCSLLTAPADRELIWFVQSLSHQPGGLASVAAALLEKFSHRLGTATMVKIGNVKQCSAAEVAQIRLELPRLELRRQFPLYGETSSQLRRITGESQAERFEKIADAQRRLQSESLNDFADTAMERASYLEARGSVALAERDTAAIEAAKHHPRSYPLQAFLDLCRQAAGMDDASQDGLSPLEKDLCDLCLKPSRNLNTVAPWYFADLVAVLQEYRQQWLAEKSKGIVTTLGQRVFEALDYCEQTGSLILLEGNARLGKTFAARAWCERHPGRARFVEVPPGNDDASFFRALARGLGLGNFLNYKVVEIRQRVESVLLERNLVLVLDEGQRLFPQMNLRYGFPGRVVWMMTMANAGVPIGIISTPQFILAQKALEKTGWNSAQLSGRIGYYEFLPQELTLADLKAVGRSVLPEANEEILGVLASYARMSARYLAAVDAIAKRAQFIAQRNGRTECTAADVKAAMRESVIPSDTLLARNLEAAKKTTNRATPLPPATEPAPLAPPVSAPARQLCPPDSGEVSFKSREIRPLSAELLEA